MAQNRFSKEWYEHGRQPYPYLKEHWFQQYVKEHPQKFGFSELEGPFDTGPDFIGVLKARRFKGRRLKIEVERDYLAYLEHEHPIYDVLIVGVVDPPLHSMVPLLPPIVKTIDPKKVFDWSKPMREDYRKKRESQPVHIIVDMSVYKCPACDSILLELEEDTTHMSEGQLVNHLAGFGIPFYCKSCEEIILLDIDIEVL